ncbi:hypothetical protein [Sphingobacterium sp. SYP-B4668]|uniref:hypothetical protein n=1 Tax=Sphingobacterium sp. SYP-B4668 TaxID=2996035 RepID=UPI0022DDF6D9|nr:hypothetical protein [Sphingobacterium sp. SYP-B4668]
MIRTQVIFLAIAAGLLLMASCSNETVYPQNEGGGKSQNGRMVSQNYYTFKFKVDEGGKVALVEYSLF